MASSCWPWPFPLLVCSQTRREKRRAAQKDRIARLPVEIDPAKFIKPCKIANRRPFCQAGSDKGGLVQPEPLPPTLATIGQPIQNREKTGRFFDFRSASSS
jgi:hypothetical protein